MFSTNTRLPKSLRSGMAMSYMCKLDKETGIPDGRTSLCVCATLPDPKPLGTTSSQKNDSQLPGEYRFKNIAPVSIKNLIRRVAAMLFPALIVLGGLPGSGKTNFLKNILSMKNVNPAENQPAFCQNLIVATGFTTVSRKSLRAHQVETQWESLCYSFISGICSHLKTNPKFDVPDASEAYDDKMLQETAKRLCDYMQEIDSVQPQPHKQGSSTRIANIEKFLHMGVWTSCIWELTVNRTVLRFLECFRGHLYNSYVWLFVDLDRDFDKLHDPPDPSTTKYAMKWRSRLHYLLRASCLSEPPQQAGQPQLQRNKVCRLIAIHKGLDKTLLVKRIKKLKEEAMNASAHYGLSDLIDFDIHPVDISSDDSQKNAYHFFMNFLNGSQTESVSLSWIFLRLTLFFYQDSSMFMDFDYLLELAKRLGIDKEEVNEFLKFYTSFGNLLYVGLVDESSPYVILDPAKFLLDLCNLLKDTSLKYGIIKQSKAMEIFEEEYDKYFAILTSVGLAAKVQADKALLPSDYQLDEGDTFFYYMSVVRSGKPDQKNLPEAVQLVSGLRSPALNMQIAFTKQLLEQEFLLISCEKMNVTKFKVGVVKVEFVVQADVVEIRIDPNDCGIDQLNKICETIVKAIKEIANLKTKRGGKVEYQLRHICRRNVKDDSCKCIVCQKYHILTDQLDTCDCNPYEGLQVYEHFKIAVERSELRDTKENISFSKITADDVLPLAREIQRNEKDIAVLSRILGTGEDHDFSGHEWFDVLTMIMDWRKKSTRSSKEQLAKLLLQASMSSKFPLEERQVELFKKMARNLHIQTYSAEMQHKRKNLSQ